MSIFLNFCYYRALFWIQSKIYDETFGKIVNDYNLSNNFSQKFPSCIHHNSSMYYMYEIYVTKVRQYSSLAQCYYSAWIKEVSRITTLARVKMSRYQLTPFFNLRNPCGIQVKFLISFCYLTSVVTRFSASLIVLARNVNAQFHKMNYSPSQNMVSIITICEMELEHYYQKLNVRVVERLKIQSLRKWGNFRKILMWPVSVSKIKICQ